MLLTRLEAKQQNVSRYAGKVCSKHPELKGERYVASFGCVACSLDAVKRNQAKNMDLVHARNKQYRMANAEKTKQRHHDWRMANLEHDSLRKKKYNEKNADKVKQRYKQYYESNYPKVLAKRNKQHADKLNRTPAWLNQDDFWVIEEAYDLAALRTQLFGFPWHVDHEIPLRGKLASGLHVPGNLRVIPGVENLRKGSRMEVA